MSLNRFEQDLFDYLRDHPEEQRHWQSKVAVLAAGSHGAAVGLSDALADYVRERGNHIEPFRSWMQRGGVPRTALLNLSEYLIRMWGQKPLPKKPKA